MSSRVPALFVITFSALQVFGCGLLLGTEHGDAELAQTEAGTDRACVPVACAADACGRVPDGCGGLLECGGCEGANTECAAGVCACKRLRSCLEVGKACDAINDGCDGVLSCGPCGGANEQCTDNRCVCEPTGCGDRCGQQSDGCDQVIPCAACPQGENCGGGGADRCGTGVCTPLGCTTSAGQRCGNVSDGCGVIVPCGACTLPQTCGGGGVANLCGCKPKTCAQLGASCGTIDDGCGTPLDCGACTAPDSCGGGGTPNLCGCTPRSCAEQNRECGRATDGCGRALGECGPACPGGLVCNVQGRCAPTCTRPTQAEACAGKCGTVADPCGGAPFECGTGACTNDTVCAGNTCVCPEAPACAPGACQPTTNRCGATRECPACESGLGCLEGNYCGCETGGDQCGEPGNLFCCGYNEACYRCPGGQTGCYDPRGSPPSGCSG